VRSARRGVDAAASSRARVCVAYSAGRDSTALLHATARAARELGIDVVALHVHHGLMPEADAWLEFADQLILRWQKAGFPVRLVSTRLQGKPAKGESVEAWARRERRAALERLALGAAAPVILLAHHRRDQAETVLLQALRGAGPAGLAAMPRAVLRDSVWWLRPWLDQPREAIDAYVRRHRLRFVDDASNADSRFARSRLRETVWPALTGAFSDAEVALAALAHRAHQAHGLLSEVAASDLATLVDEQGRLLVPHWRALTPARRGNALRAWLLGRLERGAPETLVERLMVELPDAVASRWPVDGARELALYRGRLITRQRASRHVREEVNPHAQTIDLSRPGVHALPQWHGAFVVARADGTGVAASMLKACRVAARGGGEQWQAQPRGLPRSLKKQYQAAGIPPWQREGPLLYAGDQLVFVPGLGLDARVRAPASAGTSALTLRWLPAEPGALDQEATPQRLKSPAL